MSRFSRSRMNWIGSILVIVALLIGQSTMTYAQNSRKLQTEEAKKEAKGKTKKKKPRKVKSNQGKVRRNSRGSNREVRRTGKRDITGRKFRAKKTERARTVVPAWDPYSGRRIRTERSRAGAAAAPVRSATPRIEKARIGDISGRKRIRTRSVSSARTFQHPSFDPYYGRKRRTEADRVSRSKTFARVTRTASRSSERTQVRTVPPPRTISKSRETTSKAARSRIRTVSGQRTFTRSRNPYAGKSSARRKATTRDIAGRRLRTRGFRSTRPQGGFYQPNPYGGRILKRDDESRFSRKQMTYPNYPPSTSGEVAGGRLKSDRSTNMKNYRSPRVSVTGKSTRPRTATVASQNKVKSANNASLRTVSGQIGRVRRARDPYKIRPSRKPLRAGRDISGRKLRTKNFESPHRYSNTPLYSPYIGRSLGERKAGKPIPGSLGARSLGDRSKSRVLSALPRKYGRNDAQQYQGNRKGSKPFSGGGTISRAGWNNRNSALPNRRGDSGTGQYQGNLKGFKPIKGGGYISRLGWNNSNNSLQKKYGDTGVGKYQGVSPGYRPLKGGGYLSRLGWNNNNSPLQQKYSDNGVGKYQGGLRGFKPLKGGGYLSRLGWNNNNNPLQQKYSDNGVGKYQGGLRGFKPLKGGGYISRLGWNNNNSSLQQKYSDQGIGKFKGNIRGFKPLKGGGYLSRLGWNNNGLPLKQLHPNWGVGLYQGTTPRNKPLKGGGTLSRNGWNNEQSPLQRRYLGQSAASTFQGRYKAFKPLKGGGTLSRSNWNNKEVALPQRYSKAGPGSVFQGNLRRFKPLKGGGSLSKSGWNNDESPLRNKYSKGHVAGNYQGSLRSFKPLKGGGSLSRAVWNNDEKPLPKLYSRFDKFTRYKGNVRAAERVQANDAESLSRESWNNNELALPYTRFSRKSVFLSNLIHRLDFVYGQGKKIGDYRGDSKGPIQRIGQTKRSDHGRSRSLVFLTLGNPTQGGLVMDYRGAVARMHPSSQFAKRKDLNSLEEKSRTFKLRIWWARIFKKDSNPPKDDEAGPLRYDKRERGMWNE